MTFRRARFALFVGAAILSSSTASVVEGDEGQESDLPLLRGGRRELVPGLDLSSICEAPTLYHAIGEFVPAAFFDGAHFSFDHESLSHSFLIGPRGDITASGPGFPPNPPTQTLGSFSHYSHISPAATYVNGDKDDTCHARDKRKSAEIFFVVDRSGSTTEISYSFCEPVACHFHIIIGVPEMRLSSFGYDPKTNKFLGVNPKHGRAPFLPQVEDYALCAAIESFPDSFLLDDQHTTDPAVGDNPFQCAMDVVLHTDPGSCSVRKGDYPIIMTRSDEYSSPFATSCENYQSEGTAYESGDHFRHTACNTFAYDDETGSSQDVFKTKINGVVVDNEAPSILCPMTDVDMTTGYAFSPASISAEDNCGEAKVFCSRPIRSSCDRLNLDMFEPPRIGQDYEPPDEIGLRTGTYCFMCLAADSSTKGADGRFIYDTQSSILDEDKEYLYRDGDGKWASGIPSDTSQLYSFSRISRVSKPCLVQVNVVDE